MAGNPFEKIGCLGFAMIFIAVAFVSNALNPGNEQDAAPMMTLEQASQRVELEYAVKARLRDPESAQFKHLTSMCGYVNAKNGFGGYTGYRRFIAQPVAGSTAGIETDENSREFEKLWQEYCQPELEKLKPSTG